MFYEDMSPYTYAGDEDTFSDADDPLRDVCFRPAYERLNIGWLSAEHPWPSGPAPTGFVDRLLTILESQQVNAMLGLHDCDLCTEPLPFSHPWYEPRSGHRCASEATGEIRVPNTSDGPGPADGPGTPTVFAAPYLVGHYVADHGYLPPRPFVDAVMAFDPYGVRSARFPGVRFPLVPEDAVSRHADEE
ncbi:hypothetical protein [Streptomyces sp. NPDC057939]|uniref:DUF7919 family protein n=1 Tax=Streptomyces sp. NPDC057939 TaxID=3346284 RepID=UPI0036DFF4E5